MCTATWQLDEDRLRFFFNRDELRTRSHGEIPRVLSRDGVQLLAPRDRDAGGSWLAANEHGLVVALLNGYVEENLAAAHAPPAPEPSEGWLSRGEIVLRVAVAPHPSAAIDTLRQLNLPRFRTFVLLVLQPGEIVQRASWLDGSLVIQPITERDLPISSSSFSTREVLAHRRRSWESMNVTAASDRVAAHLAFHREHDPEAGAYSVCMSRPDAATQCFSWVDVSPQQVVMHHIDGPPCDERAPRHQLSIPRCGPER